jgi:hypothetical protein
MKFHKYADIFPLLQGEKLAALIGDIAANGQLELIWLYNGKIIDGRNRYICCQALL